MNKISVVGIDLGKSAFHVHGVDTFGATVIERRFTRKGLRSWLVRLEPCLIGMETCSGAHYLGRWLRQQGHDVRLMNPRFVKPYVKTNKNDARDAEAICGAVTRTTSPPKLLHRLIESTTQSGHHVTMSPRATFPL